MRGVAALSATVCRCATVVWLCQAQDFLDVHFMYGAVVWQLCFTVLYCTLMCLEYVNCRLPLHTLNCWTIVSA